MVLGSRAPVKGCEDASCGPTKKAQHATGQSDQRNARTPYIAAEGACQVESSSTTPDRAGGRSE